MASQPLPLAHVGIIMDGNGRWAKNKGLKRSAGHLEGVKTTKKIVKAAAEQNIGTLSLYTFSSENWQRAHEETAYLMGLITQYLRKEYAFYKENNIRVIHSGDLAGLPQAVQNEIIGVEKDTLAFNGLTVNLLINYGSRGELCRAFQRLVQQNIKPQDITEELISKNLDQNLPALDLVIRTAGEQRLSNFMLWQASYAEYAFSPKFWPDFSEADFKNILKAYALRERKFGDAQ